MHRNSYCSLKAPSLFPFTEVPTMCDFHPRLQTGVGFGPNFAARMASRRLSKRTLFFNRWNSFSLLHRSAWIALAAAKIVDFPLKRTKLGKSQKISRVRGDHSDPQAGGAHCNQRIIRQSAPSNFLVIILGG